MPTSIQEIVNLRQEPVNEELMLCAIAAAIEISREKGKSLEEIVAEVLADDPFLDLNMRRWLSQTVTQVWHLKSKTDSQSDRPLAPK